MVSWRHHMRVAAERRVGEALRRHRMDPVGRRGREVRRGRRREVRRRRRREVRRGRKERKGGEERAEGEEGR